MRVAPVMLFAALAVGAAAPALGQIEGFRYEKRETREATERATLEAYMTPMAPGPWWIIGPFDNAGQNRHDVVYPPEREIDLEAVYTDKDGRDARWRRIDDDGWSMIDLAQFGSDARNTDSIGYLYREVEADRAGEVLFEAGSDDGLKLWVNGRLLIDADVYRGMNIQDHVLHIPLRRGHNTILAKVTQGVGSWQFQMRPRLDGRVSALLHWHLERDFPSSREAEHYRLLTVLEPEDVVLEVGGLDVMPDGRPIMTTRRGEVWIVDGADEDPPFDATFTRFAAGLHEPLGATWRDGGLYVAQRGEVTFLQDEDGDDVADLYRTVTDAWGVSGNYHEFAFGPKFDREGRMWVTLNLGFCGGLGKSIVPWRGWAMIVNDDGTLTPVCGGLRSPNGIGADIQGAMFYTDNQGDWIATCKLSHLDFGDFHGHPGSIDWYDEAGMTKPTDVQAYKKPAVWFPYDRMGRSASDVVVDRTGGRFGPFAEQVFVGDQYSAEVMRVFLERIDGVFQGACFPFRSGFDSGVNRLAFGPGGGLYAGLTNRGWWSKGNRPWGLQRLVYTGKLPFEVHEMRIRPDGFELTFTKPVDPATAGRASSYRLASFTYEHWEKYGAPEIDRAEHRITAVQVSEDGRTVRLRTDRLRPGYVHELLLPGVRDAHGEPLLHEMAFYTVNVVPSE